MNLVYNVSDKSLSVEGTSESVAKPSIEESVSQSVNDILNSAETSIESEQIKKTGKNIASYSYFGLFIASGLALTGICLYKISKNYYSEIKNPTDKDISKYHKSRTISICLIVISGLIVLLGYLL